METPVDHQWPDSRNELTTPHDSRSTLKIDKHQTGTLKQPAVFGVRLLLGVVFIIAAADKILNPLAFAKSVDNYQILPATLINPAAIALPWIELVLGSLLIVGVWLPGAVLLVNLLLFTFFSALIFNLVRGLNVDCGCFIQSKTENPSTTWYLVRDTFFLLMGGYLAYRTFNNSDQHMSE